MSGTSPLHPQYMKMIYFKTNIYMTQNIKLGNKTNDDIVIITVAR